MDPKKTQRYRTNRYYKSAMHAAVEYPDLAMLRCEGSRTASDGAEANGGRLPGTKHVSCSLAGPNSVTCHMYMLLEESSMCAAE